MPETRLFRPAVIPILLALSAVPAVAGNPLYVNQNGVPYRWADSTVSYYTDLGGLGNQTNAQADVLVASAFQVWADIDTADITFERLGDLDEDINADNILDFFDTVSNCQNLDNSIIYDQDGSAVEALGFDSNSVLGFALASCVNAATGHYTNGMALLNGRFIDGEPNSPYHQSLTVEEFRSAFVHEFGHLIGLGHSQINVNCLTDISCPSEDLDGVPVMFPYLLGSSLEAGLTLDDRSAISMLYPSPDMSASTGRIRGKVLFADGQTPAQGYNVVVRSVLSPRSAAVSSVSGHLFTADAGNPLVPIYGLPFGSRDPSLIGYYDIAGLPPGEYTVEVEPIHGSGLYPFLYDSGVGPIGEYLGFQYKMPGKCSLQLLNFPSSPDDGCSDHTILNVAAGQDLNLDTDIILLGTPPRYDAWENGD
ncbi:MAG: hypothetical protein JW793_13410 [Acidobacteria bacterium]|nr:hypothetical protein [Acidobacteriota bacterium]